MIFKRDLYLLVWWIALIQFHFILAQKDDEHVHIKVHVPQVFKKHYHHRTVAKHHYHQPKKNYHPHHESLLKSNIAPEIDFPLLTDKAITKYIKWQEKQNSPENFITWYSESPTGYPNEKPKFLNSPLIRGENHNYDKNSVDIFNKYQSHKSPLNNIKDFRINVENDYKKFPIQQYTNYNVYDDEHDQRDEYAEEDTDSYMENTETMSLPQSLPYTSGQQGMVVLDNDDYIDTTSLTMPSDGGYSNSNFNWMQRGKRYHNNNMNYNKKQQQNYKRPFNQIDDGSIKIYGDNSWMSSQIAPNLFNEWNPMSNFQKSPSINFNKTKMNGRKPFTNISNNGRHKTLNFNNNDNFESYVNNEFGPNTFNEFRFRNKRPRRKSKPKWKRYP